MTLVAVAVAVAVGFELTPLTDSLSLTLLLLLIVLISIFADKGPFWALSEDKLLPSMLAIGIAAGQALGHLGKGVMKFVIGIIKGKTGSFPFALLPMTLMCFIGAGWSFLYENAIRSSMFRNYIINQDRYPTFQRSVRLYGTR